jgi:hypothetical protein
MGEENMSPFYHITTRENAEKILKVGLTPHQCFPRKKPAVYLFTTLEDAEHAASRYTIPGLQSLTTINTEDPCILKVSAAALKLPHRKGAGYYPANDEDLDAVDCDMDADMVWVNEIEVYARIPPALVSLISPTD